MKRVLLTLIAVAVCAFPVLSRADWDPISPDPDTKWVQMPDPNGWDVKLTSPRTLADDFPCYQTGWITDVHFWGSWRGDLVGQIDWIHLSFHDNVPAEADPVMPWSHPGELLWQTDLDVHQLTPVGAIVIREYGTGVQGWCDPYLGEYIRGDHNLIWQVNIFLDKILPREELFVQKSGPSPTDPAIYWLDIQVGVSNPAGTELVDFGWKTSLTQWQDDAVYRDEMPPVFWQPLEDPEIIRSLDLAFVLTGVPIPEPGLLCVAGLGLLALLARRRGK